MSIRNPVGALLVAGAALSLTVGLQGCTAAARPYVMHSEPPPPREELVAYWPGFFWVHGHWERGSDRWHWDSGHRERERAGYVWDDGRWERRGQRYVWLDGGWHARGDGVIREDRDR